MYRPGAIIYIGEDQVWLEGRDFRAQAEQMSWALLQWLRWVCLREERGDLVHYQSLVMDSTLYE